MNHYSSRGDTKPKGLLVFLTHDGGMPVIFALEAKAINKHLYKAADSAQATWNKRCRSAASILCVDHVGSDDGSVIR